MPTAETADAVYARFAGLKKKDKPSFATLTVGGLVHVGDAGTFVCHVREKMKIGTLRLHWVQPEEFLLALIDGSVPVRWKDAGAFVIDSAVGAIIPAKAKKAIDALDDSEELTDAIDEAIFGAKKHEAIIPLAKGAEFSVFKLPGDGTYGVEKGLDKSGAVVALLMRV